MVNLLINIKTLGRRTFGKTGTSFLVDKSIYKLAYQLCLQSNVANQMLAGHVCHVSVDQMQGILKGQSITEQLTSCLISLFCK
jgi:hypothetical protein